MRVSPAPPRGPAQVRPHDLPVPLTRLIGREAEVGVIRDALLAPEVRLLTLVGAPGIGKTRLALAVAHALADGPSASVDHEPGAEPAFADGVAFVPLAPLRDPELVLPAIAQALGVREVVGQPLVETLHAALRARQLLLVLDNCEHLPDSAPRVGDLLATCLELKVLATSRAPLHVYGEYQYLVPSLAVPDLTRLAEPEALARVPAVTLLMERARAVRPDFRLTPQNTPAVAEVCVRLDGLPLALELAAARLKLLPPNALLARMGSRLDLLTDGARDRPARHQTLRAALAWSHDLLTAKEQRLLRRLAVLAGGWTLEAAEAVCNLDGDPVVDVLDGIAALVDHSLLQQTDRSDGEPRYSMLETIREFGLEQLEASGEAGRTRRLHAEHYLALAETAQPHLTGPDQGAWLARLEADHDNIRAALVRSLAEPDGAPIAVGLAWALCRFWQRGGHVGEGRAWLARALVRGASANGETRAKLLNAAGVLARQQGDNPSARSLFEQSLAIYRRLGDRRGVANALHDLGSVIRYEGDHERAAALLDESVALCRDNGDRWGLAHALRIRGGLARDLGEVESATALYEESLALLREVGDRWSAATQLGELGILVHQQGDPDRAASLFEQNLAISRGLGDRVGTALALASLGRVAYEQHDFERSNEHYRQALRLYREDGNRWGPVVCIEGMAALAVSTGRPKRAASLVGAADVLREAIREPLPSPERAWLDRVVTAARGLLGDEAFAVAWAEGRTMTLEQAVDCALTLPEPTSAVPPDQPAVDKASDPLTSREREVATLVARGLTDPQIAEALVIGRRTAEKHVANCLGKLGLANRAGLAAWAVEWGLHTLQPD